MTVMLIDRLFALATLDDALNMDMSEVIYFFDRGTDQVGNESYRRHYYVTADPVRLLLVLHNNIKFSDLKPGTYVQVKIGKIEGGRRALRPGSHCKVGVFGILSKAPGTDEVESFGDIAEKAPPNKRYRGGRERLSPDQYVVRQNLSMTPEMQALLYKLGNGNASAGLRELERQARLSEPPSHAAVSQMADRVFQIMKIVPTQNQHLLTTKAIKEALDAHYTRQRRA